MTTSDAASDENFINMTYILMYTHMYICVQLQVDFTLCIVTGFPFVFLSDLLMNEPKFLTHTI